MRRVAAPLGGFTLGEVGPKSAAKLWHRGGFPRSFLASSDAASLRWRGELIRTYLERDIPALGLRLPATALRRFWMMLAHYHGQLETHPPGFDLVTARHSRLGDLSDATLAAGTSVTVAAGDTLHLAFAPSGADDERGEDCFLVGNRPTAAGEFSGRRGLREQETQALPLAFALHQNQPNPFARTTRIGFSLATSSRVRLDVYDLGGRRLRTLANGPYPPGEHQVEWDRRTTSGALAGPGLYFYRIAAGRLRDERRMVLLP